MALTPLRASVPQVTIQVEKTQAETFGVAVGDVYSTVQTYLGSSFVNQFTRFGHQYMVYAQADAPFRRQTESVDGYYMRTSGGQMVPLGTVARIERTQGPVGHHAVRPLPVRDDQRLGERGVQLRPGDAGRWRRSPRRRCRAGMTYEWTAMSYQEKLVGNSTYFIFAPRDPARLLRARRPVRELGHAGGRHARRAAGAARHRQRAARASAWPTTSTCRSASCC